MATAIKSAGGWILAAALVALPLSVEARRIQVDFGPESFPGSGAGWPGREGAGSPGSFDDQIDVSSGPYSDSMLFTSQYIDSGNVLGTYSSSPLLVNGSLYDSILINEDGSFSFFSSEIGAQSVDPFFSLFNKDLVSDPSQPATSPGSVSYTHGFAMGITGAAPDPDTAVAGIRLYWNNLLAADDPDGFPYEMQAYIYFLGNGDFDLDFRYGEGDWANSVGAQTIRAGDAPLYSNANDLAATTDTLSYFFSFRNGVLQGGTDPEPPVGVPEPATGTLLIAGIAGLFFAHRRRLRLSR